MNHFYELWFAICIFFSVTFALLSTWTCKVLLSSFEFLITCAKGCSQAWQAFREWYDKWFTKIVFLVHTVSYRSPIFLTGAINRRGKTWSVTYNSTDLHSCPQKVHSIWSALRITTAGKFQHQKSDIHRLPVTLYMFRVKSETNSLCMLRKLGFPEVTILGANQKEHGLWE